MRRVLATALAVAAPLVADAQFRPEPLVVPVPGNLVDVVAAPLSGLAVADLLAADPLSGAVSLRADRALLAAAALAAARPAAFDYVRAGRLRPGAADGRADVAWCRGSLNVVLGDDPGVVHTFTRPPESWRTSTLPATFAHLLPRDADVIAIPFETGRIDTGELHLVDVDPVALTQSEVRLPTSKGLSQRVAVPDELFPLRVSAPARALGLDDLVLPQANAFRLWTHAAPPAGPALGDLRLEEVTVAPDPGATGLPPREVLGVGPLDVDGDGVLDLVFSWSDAYRFTAPADVRPAHLLWVRGTGIPADFATAAVGRLDAHPDLQPLSDPAFGRSFELGGRPAYVLWDRGLDEVLVVTSAGRGRLSVWRGSAAGRAIRDFRLADVVGSPAPDLVADATYYVDDFHPPAAPAVLVYPDLGDASPEVAWAPGSPGLPARGEDHRLEVVAGDADGALVLDWMLGDPYGPPVAHDPALVIPGEALCAALPQRIDVTVRATDALGVWADVGATLDVGLAPPALAVAGAAPPGRIVLPPGGTVAALEGSIWSGCGLPVAFTWGGTLPASLWGALDEGATWSRRTLELPEASYPELLAEPREVTLTASDGTYASPAAVLALDLDARGLVEVDHEADRAALDAGEVAVLRTRLRSRIGVPLPFVRVRDLLRGLEPAGPPRVTGAAAVEVAGGGAELVLELLPAAGAEVVVELPVRGAGATGASAVEARSAGGHLLTPAADAAAPGHRLPGCGCASGAEAGPAALLLALLRRRRRRAT